MKVYRYIIVFFLSFLVFSVAIVTEYAYAKSDIEKELEKEINDNLSYLIEPELDEYFKKIEINGKPFALKELIYGIINGDFDISLDNLVDFFISSLKDSLKSSFVSLLSILVLSLLYSISSALTSGFKKEGTKELIHLVIYGSIICTITITIGSLISNVTNTLREIAKIFELSFPIILTIITALGGSASISTFSTITMVYSEILIKIITNLLIPLFFAVTVFTIVGHLSDTVKLNKLKNSFKSIGNWTLGITFSILTTFVTMQGLVGASIDSISIKSAKFALSSYVPILGGYLSEGFDIVMGSLIIIKNAFGFSIFLALLSLILTPIIKILIFSLSLKLVAGFVETTGGDKISALLYDISINFNMLLSIFAGVFFIVFLFMVLTVGAFNGGVL